MSRTARMMAQALETVSTLAQGVLTNIREGDVGTTMGWGFAPWSGGPLSWLDIIGAPKAIAIRDMLVDQHGNRFAAPDLLHELAEQGETFYGRYRPERSAA